MFTIPKTNVITSSDGFSVEVLGQTGMKYSEEGRSLLFYSEVFAPDAIAIWPKTIQKWDPPFEHVPIDAEERKRIVNNIERAFEFKGARIKRC